MIFRSAEQKADLESSFNRPDRPFFAAGACHVLAGAFLEQSKRKDWRATLIEPHPGFRGMHVIVRNSRFAFDYHGYTQVDRFLDHYFHKMNRWFPGWSADLVDLRCSPTGKEFCTKYHHRLPEQFFKDPLPRAINYVRKFDVPADA